MARNAQPLTEDLQKKIDAGIAIPNTGESVTQEEVEERFSRLIRQDREKILSTLESLGKGTSR